MTLSLIMINKNIKIQYRGSYFVVKNNTIENGICLFSHTLSQNGDTILLFMFSPNIDRF